MFEIEVICKGILQIYGHSPKNRLIVHSLKNMCDAYRHAYEIVMDNLAKKDLPIEEYRRRSSIFLDFYHANVFRMINKAVYTIIETRD